MKKIHHERHKVRRLRIGGVVEFVDCGVYGLIKYLNTLKGIHTLYCCQGTKDSRAHVVIGGKKSTAFMLAWLREWYHLRAGSLDCGNWNITWMTWAYRKAFKAAKKAARKVNL